MPKYVIDEDTLIGLGDAIRSVTGEAKNYTPNEMIEEVKNILNATTFILVDDAGNEYPAAYLDSAVRVTAGPNDIRKGTTAITTDGLIIGEKEIPSYRAIEGCVKIKPGSAMNIPLFSDMCEYTVLQAIICAYNTRIDDSVAAKRVVIDSNVYEVNSIESLSVVSVDSDKQTIVLGVTNDSTENEVIHYMIIKEDE